jgi:hypothetical protein
VQTYPRGIVATRSLDCAASLVLGGLCVVFGASLTFRELPWLGSLTSGLGLDSASRFPIRFACQWLFIGNILPKKHSLRALWASRSWITLRFRAS